MDSLILILIEHIMIYFAFAETSNIPDNLRFRIREKWEEDATEENE